MDKFPKFNIGFSDHSLGHELSLAAVAMGATIIEKHVTLDRNDISPAEHHFSMEPGEVLNTARSEATSWECVISVRHSAALVAAV